MKIKILNGIYREKEFEFTTPTVSIGRDSGNQLILDTDGVSRCHAVLKQLPDGCWEVSDLNSTNGVKINGTRIDGPVKIHEASKIIIGENELLVTGLSQEPPQVIFNPIISLSPAENSVENSVENSAEKKNVLPPQDEPVALKLNLTPENQKKTPEKLAAVRTDITGIWDVTKFKGSLFGNKENSAGAGNENAKTAENASEENEARKRRSNLIFYSIVACVVIMILSFAFSIIAPAKKSKVARSSEKPLAVHYQKEIISRDNVFRFDFHLKSHIQKRTVTRKTDEGEKQVSTYVREYVVCFTIDDIASRRHFSREVTVSPDTVEQLRTAINSSGIFAIREDSGNRDDSFNRSLTVVEGKRLVHTTVPGQYGSNEFNAVEEAVIEVAESFGLKTISMTPEQLLTQAERHFYKAEEFFSNPSRPSNLRDAIKRYRMVVDSLEQFSPKPPMWDKARRQLETASKQRELKMGALEVEFKRLGQVGDLARMRNIFLEMMELSEPDSREYIRAKERLVKIEQYLRKKKSRR